MSQIEELQGRIVAAMQRIGEGLESLAEQKAEPDPGVTEALEEERLANLQLQERLQTIKARHLGEVETLKRALNAQVDAATQLDQDLQRLRAANAGLRESNAALRAANAEGVGAPELINQALQAELEALQAARAVETAEARAILAQLQPLLSGAPETQAEQEDA